MDDAMRDTFARQGYVIVPDVLNQQQLDELNEVYDQHILEREEIRLIDFPSRDVWAST